MAIDLVLSRAAGLGVGDSVTFSRPALVSTVAALVRGKAQELGLDEAGLEGPAEDVRRMTFEITGIAVLPMQRTEEHSQASLTLAGLVALLAPGADEIEAAREWVPADLHPMLQEEADRTIACGVPADDCSGRTHRRVWVRLVADCSGHVAVIALKRQAASAKFPTPEHSG